VILTGYTPGHNCLVLGAPRSGTHALASIIQSRLPFKYLGEIGMAQKSSRPWFDLGIFTESHDMPRLAHVVQSRAKLGALQLVEKIKINTFVIALRRRDKGKQFASWIYFRHIGAIYNFDHGGQDYVGPDTLTVTYDDIEQFIVDQIIDDQFDPNLIMYYEDIDFGASVIKKNSYCFPPEQMIKNIDLVKEALQHWRYNT
jgi:hypothetical protein